MSMVIVSDETYRTITVYDPDDDEGLSEGDARARATEELNDAGRWTWIDCEYINYNRIDVRFQLL